MAAISRVLYWQNQLERMEMNRDIEEGIQVEACEHELDASSQHTLQTMGERQLLEISSISQGNHQRQMQIQAIEERDHPTLTRGTNGAQDEDEQVLALQKIGLKVIKIWALPFAMGVTITLFQVVVTNELIMSTKRSSLKRCSKSLLVTILSSAVLFALSQIQSNFPRKLLIIKLIIALTFTSITINIGMLLTFIWEFV